MKKLITILLLFFVYNPLLAVTKPSYLQLKDVPQIDIRQFGAKAEVGFDNTAAFEAAATYATTNGGNVAFIIPEGTFNIVPGGAATPAGSRTLWSCFELDEIDNVSIIGLPGSKITSTLDMGSASTDGQSMWLFNFIACDNIVLDNVTVDITVEGTPNVADTSQYELAAVVFYNLEDGTQAASGLTVKNCNFKINNSVSGNANGNGYKFSTIFAQGYYVTTPSVDKPAATDISIENNRFPDGQGPVVWFNNVERANVIGNRFVDCGGPLYCIRGTGPTKDVIISENFFKMKHQPGQTVATVHNYPVHFSGAANWETESAMKSSGLRVVNNEFNTLSGESFYCGGNSDVVFYGNKIETGSAIADVATGGSVVIRNGSEDATTEPTTSAVVSNNTFLNLRNAAIQSNDAIGALVMSDNSFNNCWKAFAGFSDVDDFVPNCVTFNDNSVVGCASAAFTLKHPVAASSPTIIVSGNSFLDNDDSAINDATSTGAGVWNITNNAFMDNGSVAGASTVNLTYGSFNIVGNYFKNNGGTDIEVNGNNAISYVKGQVISNNHVEGSGNNGIAVLGNLFNINGNTILDTTATGILVAATTKARYVNISSNLIQGAVDGISIASASESLVSGNVIYGSGTAIASGTAGVTTTNNIP